MKYKLEIANCRGKKPVINVIKKACKSLNDIMIEINDCEGKAKLEEAENILWWILKDNE